jgi:hypothetical protein
VAARPVAGSPPQTAAHGADIVALATTDDGLAGASADARDGIRLWPALDGTREPVVIRAPAPRALALAVPQGVRPRGARSTSTGRRPAT